MKSISTLLLREVTGAPRLTASGWNAMLQVSIVSSLSRTKAVSQAPTRLERRWRSKDKTGRRASTWNAQTRCVAMVFRW